MEFQDEVRLQAADLCALLLNTHPFYAMISRLAHPT